MIKKNILFFLFISFYSFSQEIDTINSRLQAMRNNDITFYNIDGYNITSQVIYSEYNEKNLKKAFKKYSIKEDDLKTKDDSLSFNNIYITKTHKIAENLIQNNSYYFVENNDKWIVAIWLGSINKHDNDFDRDFTQIILKNEVPEECFTSKTIDSINFAGRKIKLGNNCYWTNINSVQCPYYGEMNWSVHKDLDDAKKTVEQQLLITKSKNGGKVISEEITNITFEEVPTKAKKVIYDFTGVKSLLAGMSGGKTLTIYYVAEKIRENYVSCVLSYWNNDEINESGLPPLLEKVMKLKN